jgi:hypothetical protein
MIGPSSISPRPQPPAVEWIQDQIKPLLSIDDIHFYVSYLSDLTNERLRKDEMPDKYSY